MVSETSHYISFCSFLFTILLLSVNFYHRVVAGNGTAASGKRPPPPPSPSPPPVDAAEQQQQLLYNQCQCKCQGDCCVNVLVLLHVVFSFVIRVVIVADTMTLSRLSCTTIDFRQEYRNQKSIIEEQSTIYPRFPFNPVQNSNHVRTVDLGMRFESESINHRMICVD